MMKKPTGMILPIGIQRSSWLTAEAHVLEEGYGERLLGVAGGTGVSPG